MVMRAVVFDIGGVLEITPDLGVDRRWETRLGLPDGEIDVGACVAGARDAGLHAIRYRDNAQSIAEIEKMLTSP